MCCIMCKPTSAFCLIYDATGLTLGLRNSAIRCHRRTCWRRETAPDRSLHSDTHRFAPPSGVRCCQWTRCPLRVVWQNARARGATPVTAPRSVISAALTLTSGLRLNAMANRRKQRRFLALRLPSMSRALERRDKKPYTPTSSQEAA